MASPQEGHHRGTTTTFFRANQGPSLLTTPVLCVSNAASKFWLRACPMGRAPVTLPHVVRTVANAPSPYHSLPHPPCPHEASTTLETHEEGSKLASEMQIWWPVVRLPPVLSTRPHALHSHALWVLSFGNGCVCSLQPKSESLMDPTCENRAKE